MSSDLILPEAGGDYLDNLGRGFCGPLAFFGALNHLNQPTGRRLSRSAETGMMDDVRVSMIELLEGLDANELGNISSESAGIIFSRKKIRLIYKFSYDF